MVSIDAETTAADSIPAYSRTWTYDSIGNITDRTTENGAQSWDYDYSNSAYGPHAVNTVDFTTGADWTFAYDANGNMTSRVNNTGVYTLTYNAENKLATAAVGDTTITYTYDANGTLVKKVTDDGTSTTDLYIGGHYAIMDGTIRKTYMFNGQAVAVKNGATLEYLLGDHLGSASVSTNTSGNVTSEQRYYPYGEVRWSTGSDMPTDYTYTSQRDDFYTQLYDFDARYYDPYINRFIQADTIVPEPGNSQALNRYSYVYNSPLNYNDPNGHDPIGWMWRWRNRISRVQNLVRKAKYVLSVAQSYNLVPFIPPKNFTTPRAAPSSTDVTGWLINQMVANQQSDVVNIIYNHMMSGGLLRMDAAMQGWTALVGTGNIWDFKDDLKGAGILIDGTNDVILAGHQLNYDFIANMHYGYVGRAAGFDSEFLVIAAGLAQIGRAAETMKVDDLGQFSFECWGDHPYATYAVKFGIYVYSEFGYRPDELTYEELAHLLETYIANHGTPPEPPPGALPGSGE